MREGTARPERVLALLDGVLAMLAVMGAATLISCGGLLTTIKNLALYIGQRYRELESPHAQQPSRETEAQLMEVVGRHVGGADWVAAIFQPPVHLIPDLLPALLSPPPLPEGEAGGPGGPIPQGLSALLPQFPWDEVGSLGEAAVAEGVLRPLLAFGSRLAVAAAEADGDADPAHLQLQALLLKVLLEVAEACKSQSRQQAHIALLLLTLAFVRGLPVQEVEKALEAGWGGEAARPGGVVEWAEQVWGSPRCPQPAAAAHLIATLPWPHLLPQMDGSCRLRGVLLLLTTAASLQGSTPEVLEAILPWICRVLGTREGLPCLGTDVSEEEAHMLCMLDAPTQASRTTLGTLWLFLRLSLATSLLRKWAASSSSSPKAAGLAAALLEGMQFGRLLKQAVYADPVPGFKSILLRAVAALSAFGPTLYPNWVEPVVEVVVDAFHQNIPIFPVVHAHFDQRLRPPAPRPASPGGPALPPEGEVAAVHAGSTADTASPPGATDTLQEADAWLVALIACLGRDGLPPAALVLLNDLTQLIYYRSVSLAAEGPPSFQSLARAAVSLLGREGALGLWPALLRQATDDPKHFQWLAVLATWISAAASTDGGEGAAQPGASELLPDQDQQRLAVYAEEAIQLQEVAVRVGYGGRPCRCGRSCWLASSSTVPHWRRYCPGQR
eukprot:jgi/Botrbrau1/7722/Bobra.0159s0154.1